MTKRRHQREADGLWRGRVGRPPAPRVCAPSVGPALRRPEPSPDRARSRSTAVDPRASVSPVRILVGGVPIKMACSATASRRDGRPRAGRARDRSRGTKHRLGRLGDPTSLISAFDPGETAYLKVSVRLAELQSARWPGPRHRRTDERRGRGERLSPADGRARDRRELAETTRIPPPRGTGSCSGTLNGISNLLDSWRNHCTVSLRDRIETGLLQAATKRSLIRPTCPCGT